jgi:lysophospholipid acyltransferase
LVGIFDLWLNGIGTLAVSAVGAYSIATYLKTSPYMPWIGFIYLMGHMSISHIWRQAANDPGSVDITGAQMVLLMKLSSFCWNVADGQLPADQLSDYQKDRMLKEVPSVLDYAAWVLFFPSLMAGPAFDYADYRRWIDTTMFDVPAEVDPAKKPPVRKKRKIPRSGTPATRKAAAGLIWLGLFVYFGASYNPEFLSSDVFLKYNVFQRVWLNYVTNVVARFKYYAVWSLSEGACILAGMGYNGFDPVTAKVSWNRLQNIDPWQVEFAQNPRGYLAGWNMNTNNWLRNSVYLRVTPRGKKPGFRASLITFATSALWHGFYPGYYLTFVLASLIQTVAKRKPLNFHLPLDSSTVALISFRLPPTCPPLLPRPRHRSCSSHQEILRLRLLPSHPNHFLIRNHTFLDPHPARLPTCLVRSLLLRSDLDPRRSCILLLSRQSMAEEEAGVETGQGEREVGQDS